MQTFLDVLQDQGLALVALLLAAWALGRTFRKKAGESKTLFPGDAQAELGPAEFDFFETHEKTHVIREQKLLNQLCLDFINVGQDLFYDNLEFSRYNKRLEVEILAQENLGVFHKDEDEQKIGKDEKLRICFEREMGEELIYDIKIFFRDAQGKLYAQEVQGSKGSTPVVGKRFPLGN